MGDPAYSLSAARCCEAIAELGEGPVWDPARHELSWVDILAGRLYRARVEADRLDLVAVLDVGCHLGAAVPAAGRGWVIAAGTGFALMGEDGTLSWVLRPEAGRGSEMRMNDGACDAAGRFWAGSMAYDNRPGAGSLYCLSPDLSVRRVLGGITVSNGIGWSADNRTMWFVDSGAGTVDAFDYDLETGAIGGRRTLIEIDPDDGVPDGLAVDEHDCIWVAIWDGGQIRRFSPKGRLLGVVDVPTSRPTSCCFGGHDLSTLFITTAREGLTPEQLASEPDAGRIFSVKPGIRGRPTAAFGGSIDSQRSREALEPTGRPGRAAVAPRSRV